VLTDGRLRDFAELAGYDCAAYCSGEATRWSGDVVTPFQVNVPVVVDGVGVMLGQYVYAIPEGEGDDVLAEARKTEAEDEAFRAGIAGEDTSGPSTGASER
jgi:regulator of RNase E activity RraA